MTPTPKDPAVSPKMKSVTFRLTPDLVVGLKREAKARKAGQSALVRGIVAEFIIKAEKARAAEAAR